MSDSNNQREAVILSAARTPVGRFMGQLSNINAPDLGALAVQEALTRSGIDPATVYEVIMGIVVSSAAGQAPARQAALRGGLGDTVGATAVNKVCGSGLKSVMLAANGIMAGEADVFVAGGMENMSRAPYLLPKARQGTGSGADGPGAGRADGESGHPPRNGDPRASAEIHRPGHDGTARDSRARPGGTVRRPGAAPVQGP